MKKRNFLFVSLICLMAAAMSSCGSSKKPVRLTYSIYSLPEVSYDDMKKRVGADDITAFDSKGNPIATQRTYDGKLIFSNARGSYYFKPTPAGFKPDSVTWGRIFPERDEDLAWENDNVAFRAYGPPLQKRGEKSYGYDLFCKRAVGFPVLETLYAGQCSGENWRKYHELNKQGKGKEAKELEKLFTYHVDHGLGMDCYAVGQTLGDGGTAVVLQDGSLAFPWCYEKAEILDNGPLRFTVHLTMSPMNIDGIEVVEHRIISLDAGSNLNRTEIWYEGMQKPHLLATGFVLHDDGPITANVAGRYMSYVDPTTDPNAGNGKIFVGVVLKEKPIEMKEVKANGMRDFVAISKYSPGDRYIYYWGFAWEKGSLVGSSFPTLNAWNAYLQNMANRVK